MPVIVDLAPVRCADVSPADRIEATRTTPHPPAPVTKQQTRAWIDALEVSQVKKNAALDRAHSALDACKGSSK